MKINMKSRNPGNLEGRKISIFKIEKYSRLVFAVGLVCFVLRWRKGEHAGKRAPHTSLVSAQAGESFLEINSSISIAHKKPLLHSQRNNQNAQGGTLKGEKKNTNY